MKTIEMEKAMGLLEEAEKLGREELVALQAERLKELVKFVRENSPYFQELYRDIPEDFVLTDLPATRKEELIPRYNDWVTERGIKREEVLAFTEDPDAGPLFLGKYTALHTSGTTGEPMPLLRDSYHNVIHGAMLKRRLLGDAAQYMDIKKHRRAAVVYAQKGASSYNSYLRTIAANPGYEDHFIVVSTTEPSDKIIKTIGDFKPEQVSGYPSSLALLAQAQLEGKLDLHLKMVASSAEVMTDEIFDMVKKAFGCVIVNNYCSTEGGEAAMASDCPHLHINEDWVLIEPVDAAGNVMPLDSKEWSEGILVTDLTNQIQPIIRYYMSDKVRIHTEDDGYGKPFHWMEIRGRVGGFFTFCGKTIMQVVLVDCTENKVLLSQFIQNAPDEMEIRVIPLPGRGKAETLADVKEHFTRLMEAEGCRDFKVVCSEEDLIKNQRGGKLTSYLKNY